MTQRPPYRFIHRERVFIEHTDQSGTIYHTRYIEWMERARTSWLLSVEPDLFAEFEAQDCTFVVHKLDITYHKSAKLYDTLELGVVIEKQTPTRLYFYQDAREEKSGLLLCEAHIVVAGLNRKTLRPTLIPRRLVS